mgnify:CR=1 FL=1
MILLDTNVLIDAFDPHSAYAPWARELIAEAVDGEGAAVNAVSLAEICVGDEDPPSVTDRSRSYGIQIVDVPAAAADVCARAYRRYRTRRTSAAGTTSPTMPLPDFFIGAHAVVMSWQLATADRGRFRSSFPSLRLLTPG